MDQNLKRRNVRTVTEETDESEEESTDTDDPKTITTEKTITNEPRSSFQVKSNSMLLN